MKKMTILLIVIFGGLWFASSYLGPQAPLVDGLYLSYTYGNSSTIRVTFIQISRNQFRATTSPGNSEKVVDRKLHPTNGRVYQPDLLGPLWIPPGSVKVGGNAHGDTVSEVTHWKNWDVGVVKASFGVGGALRGEWYYEKNTGLLVGGKRSTVLSGEDEGMNFILTETNLENL